MSAACGPSRAKPEMGLRAVVAYKAVKACGELVLAGLLGGLLAGGGTVARIRALDAMLRAHVTAAWSLRLSELLARVATPRNVALTIAALVFDAALTAGEGWALYRQFVWAPWLVVVTTTSLLPFELIELVREPRAGRVLVLAVNVAIVCYLARRARRHVAR